MYLYRANHPNFNFNEDDNDFADLDFSELDRLAGYKDDVSINSEAEAEAGARAGVGAGIVPDALVESGAADTRNALEAGI